MKKLFKKKGFTLVELLVVIAIIAILGTVSVVGYIGFTEDAKVSNDFTELTEYKTVAEAKLFDGSEVVTLSEAEKYTSEEIVTISAKTYVKDTVYSDDATAPTYSLWQKDNAGGADYKENLTDYNVEAKVGDIKTAAVYKQFVYTVSGDSKAIALYNYDWNSEKESYEKGDLDSTASDIKTCLVNLLSNATGETVEDDYFFIDGNLTSVGYRHSASAVTGESGINSYKVVWTIADSTVAKK